MNKPYTITRDPFSPALTASCRPNMGTCFACGKPGIGEHAAQQWLNSRLQLQND